MATFLFDSIVFGPVRSRRLGVSLGVNLLPTDSKVCSFDCIYCECGWTQSMASGNLPTRDNVRRALDKKLAEMQFKGDDLDVITFAGNGEPTLHPEFAGIIDDTISIRNSYFPNARIAVLSNSTMIHRSDVISALNKVDQNILKLDSAFDHTIQLLNKPMMKFDVKSLVEQLTQFKGNLIIQTLFVKGTINNQVVDNTTPDEIGAWLKLIDEIKPREVMVYTIARDTPAQDLKKIPIVELSSIAMRVEQLGIPVQVSS
ncbi:MAG TPA: radical SAM protein [Tenuifilaceae bacterium]|nr:radical SAM protein [Tenuifilaceae bacterium]HPI46091.1 radical SAM protein [Tenuifilaceae bacterium]HPN21794.1 radical SAM protein [Tenuifilaceae bacterium]